MSKHGETCTDCGTRYNSMDNEDCPYCNFAGELNQSSSR